MDVWMIYYICLQKKGKITFTLYAYYMEIVFIIKKVQIILVKIIYNFFKS